jgi:acyl-[acyl-carrier-protein]-phospholipid O-acyltransferase/long-chain-fatty-acid--[acyl-carrier-protein] ligase
VNILNSAFMVLGALATAGLQSSRVGVPEPVLLAALGVLNLGAAFYVRKSAAQGTA